MSDTAMSSEVVVTVKDLRVTYGDLKAVDGVSMEIHKGEIFGILGPNGAGKTTTVECIGGLRKWASGSIDVLGVDPRVDRAQTREQVGIQLQTAQLPDKMTVSEAVNLFATFYEHPAPVDELINRLGLAEKLHDKFGKLSGGQKQRLSIALALIGNPQVAILDELTTGLDPQARRDTWKLIEDIRDHGVTVILVTHFMEEAQYLCDRVCLIDHGRVITTDSPAHLSADFGQKISFTVDSGHSADQVAAQLAAIATVTEAVVREGRIFIEGRGDVVAPVIETLVTQGVVPHETRVEQSTLDDVFVALTQEAEGQ